MRGLFLAVEHRLVETGAHQRIAEAGTPLREGDVDVASIPLSRIPIRRRA